MLNLHFFLVVRDDFKILYIQISFPAYKDAYKDYLFSNFKWFDIIVRNVLERNGKNVILGHIAFCIFVFQQISVYSSLHGALNQKNNSSFDFSF